MHFSVSSASAKKITDRAKPFRMSSITLKYLAGDLYAYSVVLAKKQGSALERNRIKRYVREIMRSNRGQYPNGSYLIYINGMCRSLDKNLIRNDLEAVVFRIKDSQHR